MVNCVEAKTPACTPTASSVGRTCCSEPSLLKKIADVFFQIFRTLFVEIPSACFYAVINFFSKTASPQQRTPNLQATAVNSVRQNNSIKPYFPKGMEALAYARRKVEEYSKNGVPENTRSIKSSIESRSFTPDIDILCALCKREAAVTFNLFEKNQNDPWNQPEIIERVNSQMQMCYAISCLLLDDFKCISDSCANGPKNIEPDSHLEEIFYAFTEIYHAARGKCSWDGLREKMSIKESISMEYANLFYKEGTPQNLWNALYNDFCERVELSVNQGLVELFYRDANWTKKDLGPETFIKNPEVCSVKPYFPLGLEAFNFSLNSIKEELKEVTQSTESNSLNPEIAALDSLKSKKFDDFMKLIEQNKINTWDNQEVIKAADTCIKIGYTLSCMTLDKLKYEVQVRGIELSPDQSSLVQACTEMYRPIRGVVAWKKSPLNPKREGVFYPFRSIPENCERPFFEDGAIQNSWRALYNDFCERVKLSMDKGIFTLSNYNRKLIKKDTEKGTFIADPSLIYLEFH